MNDVRSYVQVFMNGGMNSIKVIAEGDNYKLAANGKIIAEISKTNGWHQLSGQPLSKDEMASISKQIKARPELRLFSMCEFFGIAYNIFS